MDMPYRVTRLTGFGPAVERAAFRYFGDANSFVQNAAKNECGTCEWKIRNHETDHLSLRVKVINGRVTSS